MQNTQSPPVQIPLIRRSRSFTVEQAQALIDQASLPGNSSSGAAREHDLAASQILQGKAQSTPMTT